MPKTYELYLDCGDGGRRFQALTCRELDLMPEIRRVLSEHGASSVEVHQFGQHLFTLAAN